MALNEFILFLFGLVVIFFLIIKMGQALAGVVDLFLIRKVAQSRWFLNWQYRKWYKKTGGRI